MYVSGNAPYIVESKLLSCFIWFDISVKECLVFTRAIEFRTHMPFSICDFRSC